MGEGSWTSKQRRGNSFDGKGNYIPGTQMKFFEDKKPAEASEDSKNRKRILDEIQKRCDKSNENLDEVVNEIAQRSEVKEQFHYYAKNGITDLAPIFKNWYEAHKRNREKNAKLNKTRW